MAFLRSSHTKLKLLSLRRDGLENWNFHNLKLANFCHPGLEICHFHLPLFPFSVGTVNYPISIVTYETAKFDWILHQVRVWSTFICKVVKRMVIWYILTEVASLNEINALFLTHMTVRSSQQWWSKLIITPSSIMCLHLILINFPSWKVCKLLDYNQNVLVLNITETKYKINELDYILSYTLKGPKLRQNIAQGRGNKWLNFF